MKKQILLACCILLSQYSFSQIAIAKFLGKNSSDFSLGYGAFLRIGTPVSEADELNFEAGAIFFFDKEAPEYGWASVPVKLGYRYTFDRSGTGWYALPQLGWNFYGIDPDDNNFRGPVVAMSAGYLFNASKWQPDLGVIYEMAFRKGGSPSYIGLRLTQNIVIGRRT